MRARTHTHTHTHNTCYGVGYVTSVTKLDVTCSRLNTVRHPNSKFNYILFLLHQKEPTPEPLIKSRPVPPADQPVFQPELPHRKTEVQPFSFENRYEGKPTRQDIINDELKKQAEELAKVVCVGVSVCVVSLNKEFYSHWSSHINGYLALALCFVCGYMHEWMLTPASSPTVGITVQGTSNAILCSPTGSEAREED